ncbi:hypothetical protein KGD82_27800 (plasmid) [Nocardiopsis eucommiae]|uniref:Uncharacterized protein n=1 Tax=Nocardiopsis eucommiae TaxID=2831970 RepID=A0A975QMJ1_9ACTN|nr:hypothetical protein KGD82_27800 [Nocardiopsis eucommiae]
MTMYATVTVTDPEQLPRAIAEVESSAESSKIRLRRLWHSQSAGFAATLPCGIYPRLWPTSCVTDKELARGVHTPA